MRTLNYYRRGPAEQECCTVCNFPAYYLLYSQLAFSAMVVDFFLQRPKVVYVFEAYLIQFAPGSHYFIHFEVKNFMFAQPK